jgi:hypothetical protein
MARLQRPRNYGQTQIATSGSPIGLTQLSPAVITNGLPTGDLLATGLILRLSGSLNLTTSSAGTTVTSGNLIFLRSLSIETDKHGILAQGLDGIMLNRINLFEFGTAPESTNIAANTTGTPVFNSTFRFPFQLKWGNAKEGLRPYDTILDMLLARLTVKIQLGIVTDFITGGTYTGTYAADVTNLDISGDVVDNPVVSPADQSMLPAFQRSLDVLKFPITATATGFRISLPYGDRIYNRIYVAQRNTTSLAELATVIIATGLVGVAVNGNYVMDPTPWAEIAGNNKDEYQIETMPTGFICLDFGKTNRIPDWLNVNTRQNGTLELVVDVTSVTAGSLWIGIDSIKNIQPQAQRAVAG